MWIYDGYGHDVRLRGGGRDRWQDLRVGARAGVDVEWYRESLVPCHWWLKL